MHQSFVVQYESFDRARSAAPGINFSFFLNYNQLVIFNFFHSVFCSKYFKQSQVVKICHLLKIMFLLAILEVF